MITYICECCGGYADVEEAEAFIGNERFEQSLCVDCYTKEVCDNE